LQGYIGEKHIKEILDQDKAVGIHVERLEGLAKHCLLKAIDILRNHLAEDLTEFNL